MQDPSLYSQIKAQVQQQQQQPQFPEQEHLKCPRCDSSNTKFCYYNNYNLSQPRHFCKNCRRYWTKGGALRNIPVGGGSRKNSKRSSSATTKRPSAAAAPPGSMGEALPFKGENLVEAGGGFNGGQFGSFVEGMQVVDSEVSSNGGDGFMSIHGGWPDHLSIYTPAAAAGSTFL